MVKKNRLEEIASSVGEPVQLSDTEKKKFSKIFEELKGWLDDSLKSVLKMDRLDAHRYTRLIVAALWQVDTNFEKGMEAGKPEKAPAKRPPPPPRDLKKTEEVFTNSLAALTPHERQVAEAHLDCVKQYEELGGAIVCQDCSLDKMRECIRAEDPSIIDEMDQAVGRKI